MYWVLICKLLSNNLKYFINQSPLLLMRILFITDIHDNYNPLEAKFEEFKNHKPDLILLGGDF